MDFCLVQPLIYCGEAMLLLSVCPSVKMGADSILTPHGQDDLTCYWSSGCELTLQLLDLIPMQSLPPGTLHGGLNFSSLDSVTNNWVSQVRATLTFRYQAWCSMPYHCCTSVLQETASETISFGLSSWSFLISYKTLKLAHWHLSTCFCIKHTLWHHCQSSGILTFLFASLFACLFLNVNIS